MSCRVFAAVVTWEGVGNWSDPANWSTGVTPDATSNVVFNSGSSVSTIDSSFAGTVSTVTIESSYTGTIEQLSNLTVNGSFIQSGGWFNSDRTKTFSVGGSFQIPSGEAHNFTRFSGIGTEGDPYLIYDIYGLQALNCFLGVSNSSVYFKMANDIDASITAHWDWTGSVFQGFSPIGYFPDSYHYDPAGGSTHSQVAFNGNSKVVSNLYIYRPAQFYVGLFGYRNADTGYIGVTNANITGSIHTGILAGWNNGAIVGYCYSSGTVTGTEGTGGLVGQSNGGSFWLCHSTATVASSGKNTGGLVGVGGNGYLNCYATGDVTGDSDSQGGLVGWFNGTVNGSYSTGNVTGLSNCFNTGGFVGNSAGGTILDSYSTGNVTVGSGSSGTGGFAGQGFESTFTNCYSTGKVTAASAGGFLGVDSGGTPSTNTSCYWDSTKNPMLNSASTGSLTGVSGKTTAQMKQRATYSGWDFGNILSIWTIDEGKSTPQETWQIYNWTGWSGDGDWTKLENWLVNYATPEVYPQNNTHKVLINSSGSITVPSDLTLGGLQLGAGYTGTVTLGGDLTLSSSGTREGSLNLFGGTLDAGAYNIEIDGNFIKGASSTFADDDSMVSFTGSTPSSIEGQTSFKRFVCTTPGKVLVFEPGSVNTIEAGGFLTIEGNSFNPITLKAAVPGSQWKIHPLSQKIVSNCIVYDSMNISDETIVTVSSVDKGNNTGWSFDSHLFETFSNAGGTIEPGGLIIVPTGTTREFSIYADSGYYLYDVKIDGVSTTDALSVPFLLTFESVSSTHTIEAVFYQDSYRIWDGGGATNNWSDPGNWSGDTTPESGTSVLFDATSVKNATIDASFQGNIQNITIEVGYTGTIRQTTDLTIEGSFSQSGGRFYSDTTKIFSVGQSFYITFEAETFKRFSGAGDSEEDPFIIYDVYGLQAMQSYMASYFRLNNNIDASSTSKWNWSVGLSTHEGFSPVGFTTSGDIGDLTNPFEGHFDGNNKTIFNLWIDRPSSTYAALFGTAQGASFKNVNLENVHVRGGVMAGSLGGWLQLCTETIRNCVSSGNIVVYSSGAGGLIGVSLFNNVSECASSVNVTALGSETMIFGGLIGLFDIGTLYNSTASGDINAEGNTFVGGLVGMMSVMYEGGGGTIEGCSASGDISCAGYCGGLVGTVGVSIPSDDPDTFEARGTVRNSHSTGNVVGSIYTGGLIGCIVGENGAYISNCYSSGNAGAQNSLFSGGLVGGNGTFGDVNFYGAAIDNCYALGNVTGALGIGGFAGGNIGQITDGCYSSGTVTMDESGFAIGGFTGANLGTIEGCYSTGGVNGQNAAGFAGINFGVINKCYALGNITGTGGDDFIAGFVCQNQSGIINSYSYSNVSGGNIVGGFAGGNAGTILNCYAAGSVEGIAYVGGFTAGNYINDEEYGDIPGTIEKCYARGLVTGYSDTGGLVGAIVEGSVITDSYYDESTGQSDTGKGTKETTAGMKDRATFSGWDFDNIWLMDEGTSRPYLYYQAYNWTGSSDASTWTDPGNWTVNLIENYGYPYAGVQSVFINSGTDTITIPHDITVGRLELGQGFGGTVQLGGALNIDNAGEREGSLILKGGSFNAASGTLNIDGNFKKDGGVFTCGTSTVNFADSSRISSVEGNSTFHALQCVSSGKIISFEAGSVQTIEGYFKAEGSYGSKVKLTSSDPGYRWYIDPQATRSVTFADVSDSENINATEIKAVNSVNSGNNENWSFGSFKNTRTIIIY